MASGAAVPNVWTQMNYVAPRGQCNFKPSIMSARCPCLRFMLHPLKSSSSYECDGCNHHASFHNLENKTEDEIRKRWETEAREKQDQEKRVNARPRKRLRELEYTPTAVGIGGNARLLENGTLTPDEMSDGFPSLEETGKRKGKGKAKSKADVGANAKKSGKYTTTRTVSTRTRGCAVQELLDEQDTIELD